MGKKDYYEKNKAKEYYINNKELIRDYQKEYYINNKESIKDYYKKTKI